MDERSTVGRSSGRVHPLESQQAAKLDRSAQEQANKGLDHSSDTSKHPVVLLAVLLFTASVSHCNHQPAQLVVGGKQKPQPRTLGLSSNSKPQHSSKCLNAQMLLVHVGM
jgi:hypothetical protein